MGGLRCGGVNHLVCHVQLYSVYVENIQMQGNARWRCFVRFGSHCVCTMADGWCLVPLPSPTTLYQLQLAKYDKQCLKIEKLSAHEDAFDSEEVEECQG